MFSYNYMNKQGLGINAVTAHPGFSNTNGNSMVAKFYWASFKK
jgi:hypothetical protein